MKKAGLQALPLLAAGNCPTSFLAGWNRLLPHAERIRLEKKKASLDTLEKMTTSTGRRKPPFREMRNGFLILTGLVKSSFSSPSTS